MVPCPETCQLPHWVIGRGKVRAVSSPSPLTGQPQGTSGNIRVCPVSLTTPSLSWERLKGRVEVGGQCPPRRPFKPKTATGAPELHGIVPQCPALPPPEEGVRSARPPSFPRTASPARVVAEPHCCADAAEEKAPLNSGGRGPDPGVRQKPRADWRPSGVVVLARGLARCAFLKSSPAPSFEISSGEGLQQEIWWGSWRQKYRCFILRRLPIT